MPHLPSSLLSDGELLVVNQSEPAATEPQIHNLACKTFTSSHPQPDRLRQLTPWHGATLVRGRAIAGASRKHLHLLQPRWPPMVPPHPGASPTAPIVCLLSLISDSFWARLPPAQVSLRPCIPYFHLSNFPHCLPAFVARQSLLLGAPHGGARRPAWDAARLGEPEQDARPSRDRSQRAPSRQWLSRRRVLRAGKSKAEPTFFERTKSDTDTTRYVTPYIGTPTVYTLPMPFFLLVLTKPA